MGTQKESKAHVGPVAYCTSLAASKDAGAAGCMLHPTHPYVHARELLGHLAKQFCPFFTGVCQVSRFAWLSDLHLGGWLICHIMFTWLRLLLRIRHLAVAMALSPVLVTEMFETGPEVSSLQARPWEPEDSGYVCSMCSTHLGKRLLPLDQQGAHFSHEISGWHLTVEARRLACGREPRGG